MSLTDGRTGSRIAHMPIDLNMGPPDEDAFEAYPGTPGGGRALSLPGVMAVPSPDVFKPLEGQNFNRFVEGTFGPGPLTVALIAGAVGVTRGDSTLELPLQTVGVVREITLGVIDMFTTTVLDFRFRISGSPVEGYAPLSIFPGSVARFSSTFSPESTMIPLPDGKDTTWVLTIGDGGTYQLSVQYRGWFYPKAMRTEYEAMIAGRKG